jgi:hypothetical protein
MVLPTKTTMRWKRKKLFRPVHTFLLKCIKKITNMANAGAKRSIIFLSVKVKQSRYRLGVAQSVPGS